MPLVRNIDIAALLPQKVIYIMQSLEKNGYEAVLTGGALRDILSGATPIDYDIATNCPYERTSRLFSSFKQNHKGQKHSSLLIQDNNVNIEITNFRREGRYSDKRRPDSIFFSGSFREDTKRRDFTVNAIGFSFKNGIEDYVSGISDIENKIIKTIGDPVKRFSEDPLRILRALKIHSNLGFEIEENTEKAMFEFSPYLRCVSSDVIRRELEKILVGKYIKDTIIKYVKILGFIIPELLPMENFKQNSKYHIYDVLEHTAYTVSYIESDPILRIAALFHDIGKPLKYSEENGVGHFYGHHLESVRLSDNILTRLRYNNRVKSDILTIIRYHDYGIDRNSVAVKKWLSKLGKDNYFRLMCLKRADAASHSPEYIFRVKEVEEAEAIGRKIIENNECFSLDTLNVRGEDLLDLGIKNENMSSTFTALLSKVIAEEIENEKEILLKEAQKIKEL